AIGFGAITLAALEGVEVVQLRTVAPDGSVRTTRTWVADADGATWIEAANPDRPFLHDLQARPEVLLVRRGAVQRLRAVPMPGDAPHRKIRLLLRTKYGWADRWIGLLADTSRSVAVRLDPISRGPIPGDQAGRRARNRYSSFRSSKPSGCRFSSASRRRTRNSSCFGPAKRRHHSNVDT